MRYYLPLKHETNLGPKILIFVMKPKMKYIYYVTKPKLEFALFVTIPKTKPKIICNKTKDTLRVNQFISSPKNTPNIQRHICHPAFICVIGKEYGHLQDNIKYNLRNYSPQIVYNIRLINT